VTRTLLSRRSLSVSAHVMDLYRRPAENFALFYRIRDFLRIIYSLSIFSLGCIKTPLVPFCSAFIVDKTSFIHLSICWTVSKLRASDWTAVGEIWVFPRQIVEGWGKIFESRFKGLAHSKLVCKFRGDPL